MKINYKNRYGDDFTFEKTDDGHIFMSGNFEYMRWGFPNDYSIAYAEYLRDGGDIELYEFKNEIHHNEGFLEKYRSLVKSKTDVINMIDPSGGPYLCEGMDMGGFSEEFKGMKIKGFKCKPEGYKILING